MLVVLDPQERRIFKAALIDPRIIVERMVIDWRVNGTVFLVLYYYFD